MKNVSARIRGKHPIFAADEAAWDLTGNFKGRNPAWCPS
jgi:hypothetical protein